jgi:hypothetical protein
MTTNKDILFWPGRGQNPNILSHLLSFFRQNGYCVVSIPFDYDSGEVPFKKDSDWCKWLQSNKYNWWIGISLGASLAYTMLSLSEETIQPKRITLINPFSSRKQLSIEKKFSLENQWDFSPTEYELVVNSIDMVISLFDEKIPIYHGISLLNHTRSQHKKLIFIHDYHEVKDSTAQTELAKILFGEHCESNDCCYIYKQ